MIVYITKNAVSSGIKEVDTTDLYAYRIDEGRINIWYKDSHGSAGIFTSYSAGEWYTERDMAVADAEIRRKRKIESLKKTD